MSHQITGVGLAAVSAAAVDASAPAAAIMAGSAWLGALLPDADRAGARLYRRTPIERRVPLARPLGLLARLPLRVLTVLPHRGPTHSLFGCAVAAAVAGALTSLVAPELVPLVAVGLTIGYLAHIAGDACTPGGVPLWAPVSRRRRWLLPRPARVPTGSTREYALTGLLTVALAAATIALAG
jgi:inner membrane protein